MATGCMTANFVDSYIHYWPLLNWKALNQRFGLEKERDRN